MGQRESVCVCGKLNLNASASHCHNKLGISFMFHAPRYLLPHGHPTPFALHNNPPPLSHALRSHAAHCRCLACCQ